MQRNNRRLLLFAACALLGLAGAAALASHASAAAVDINFTLKDTDTTCRQWTPGQTAMWNITLFMNGTDTSLITTPTYVWIDDANAPGMRGDNWVVILTASGNQLVNPPSYDSGNSNELAIGSGVFAPTPGTLDVYLYASQHVPPAPPTNVTLQLTPSEESENKDHNFTITATTHRTGSPTVTRRIPVCVHIPPKPRFEMGNFTAVLQSPANNDITVSFWLKNTGNTQDWYSCNVSVPREDWSWNFQQGINVGPNVTNLTNILQNITIRVRVHVPDNALARENSTVSLNCTSFKAGILGMSLFVYPPYTRITVTQYYYIFGRITGDSTLSGVPGDQLRFDFLVQNLGNGRDNGVARIVPPSNFSWNALVSPGEFDLEPLNESGDRMSAQFIVTIPLDTLIFTYDFQVNVTSAVNLTTPITQLRYHIQVKQVYEPELSPVPSRTGSPAQEIVFDFTIRNAGNGLDALLIDVVNLTDWRVFLSPPIGEKLLQVNETAAFQATVIVPKDLTKAQVGSYSQLIRITSKYAQLDIGSHIYVETNLTVIILPRVSCALDPPESDKELNPYSFPNFVATASFLLSLENTGNGGDAISMSAQAPPGFNVTLSPGHLQLTLLDTKAVLVTIIAPSALPTGEYSVRIIGRSDLNVASNCSSTYRLNIFHLDAGISSTVQSTIQNPDRPTDEVTPVVLPDITQIEDYFVKFRVTVQNVGQRAIAAGSLSLVVTDYLDCADRDPVNTEAANTCNERIVFNWTNPTNIITGVGGSVPVEYTYFAPDYLCFDTDVCRRIDPPPPVNAHIIRFALSMANEALNPNNQANVTVKVLPKGILVKDIPAAPFPILPVAAFGIVGGSVGFAFWYRFVRKPKVDEDLYASIYGGAGAPAGQSQTTAQYFAEAKQEQAQAPQPQAQGLSDEQLEEARRLYGDNYGR